MTLDMDISDFKALAESLEATVTALAIIIGGIWALRRYVFEKEGFPRIEFIVDAEFIGVQQNEWVVEILGLLRNQGSVLHQINRFQFSVRALSDTDLLQDGKDIRGQLVFPHKIIKSSWTPNDTKAPMVIMPGVNLRYGYQYHVPVSTTFLLIQGALDYTEHGGLEHRADRSRKCRLIRMSAAILQLTRQIQPSPKALVELADCFRLRCQRAFGPPDLRRYVAVI